MAELGGYIELDKYVLPMTHDGAIPLNCGRNCLAYLIRAKKIRKMAIPFFLCDSVTNVCKKEGVTIRYYHVGLNFLPSDIVLENGEWLYVVNYYGQVNCGTIQKFVLEYKRIIIDNVQAYFQMPIENVDTLYSCRKYFGVSDGAFLYTDAGLDEKLPLDESFDRMRFLLGRFERTASEFYEEYIKNNLLFESQPIKRMSKLTKNLLHGIDYESVRNKRTENFTYLHSVLKGINLLELSIPLGAFMYPLYLPFGNEIRLKLQREKIYIPVLWPDVLLHCEASQTESDMAKNILPLPVDQRYEKEDMECLAARVMRIYAEYQRF